MFAPNAVADWKKFRKKDLIVAGGWVGVGFDTMGVFCQVETTQSCVKPTVDKMLSLLPIQKFVNHSVEDQIISNMPLL